MNREELREKIARKLEANPTLKTAMLAETLGVPEAEVLRAMPEGMARELDATKAEEIIKSLEGLGTLYVVVRNAVAVMELHGQFAGFSRSGPFLNVAHAPLHLHLRLDRIATVFVLAPHGSEPANSASIQFFDPTGSSGIKAFILPGSGEKEGAVTAERVAQLMAIAAQYSAHCAV
jgi:putative heme iron utilization protein